MNELFLNRKTSLVIDGDYILKLTSVIHFKLKCQKFQCGASKKM